jgi:hypothetical protein
MGIARRTAKGSTFGSKLDAVYIDADLPALRAGFAALPVTNPRLQGDYLNGMQLLDALLDPLTRLRSR